mgnify:CR=1 FL=1|tara:strand:- start:12546 stop:12827 length:282 start_codon:yes stop_codon:yes gene_type:complete
MSKIITKKDLDVVIESTLKEAGLVSEDESCSTCGETVCECGTSYMEEEVTEEVTEDVVDSSVNDLSESINQTTKKEFLKEEMDNFNKLINYRK